MLDKFTKQPYNLLINSKEDHKEDYIMKKLLSILLLITMLASCASFMTGCDLFSDSDRKSSSKKDDDKKDDELNIESDDLSDEETDEIFMESKTIRYDLVDIALASVTVDDYDYNYIEFDQADETYYTENKVNGITTTQSGSYAQDSDGNITFTNNKNPEQDYLLYPGEDAYFKGNKFYLSANIPGYGDVSLIYEK